MFQKKPPLFNTDPAVTPPKSRTVWRTKGFNFKQRNDEELYDYRSTAPAKPSKSMKAAVS